MSTTTTREGAVMHAEVIAIGNRIEGMGHRPVCSCGWVSRAYPLGYLDAARAALAAHVSEHGSTRRVG